MGLSNAPAGDLNWQTPLPREHPDLQEFRLFIRFRTVKSTVMRSTCYSKAYESRPAHARLRSYWKPQLGLQVHPAQWRTEGTPGRFIVQAC